MAGIRLSITASIERDLSLSRFSLLISLIRSTLLTHLLIAGSSKSTSNLLDLSTGQFLHKLTSEILGPERVLRLLRVRSKQRHKNLRQATELILSGRLEKRHGRQIDGVGGILGVRNDNSLGRTLVRLNIDRAEQVLSVSEISILLCLAQTGTTLRLIFALGFAKVFPLETVLLPVLFYALGLGLLVCGSLGFSSGFGFGGLFGLLALNFGVFAGIP